MQEPSSRAGRERRHGIDVPEVRARAGVGTPSTRMWGKATLAPLSSPSTVVVAEVMPSGVKTRAATRSSHLLPVSVSCSAATAARGY